MMAGGITQRQLLNCRVENRYYTPEEYMTLALIQKYKLSLLCNSMNRPPGSYNATQKGTFPAGYFDPENWPDGGPM